MADIEITPGLILKTSLKGHNDIIHRIAWAPNGRIIASPSRDKSIRVWDYESESCQILKGHSHWVNSLAWSPDNKLLASGDEAGSIWIWDIESKSKIKEFQEHQGRIECLDWSPDGLHIGSASGDGSVIILSAQNWEVVKIIRDHHEWVNAISWSKEGDFFATGAEDNTVKIWNSKTFKLVHTLRGNSAWVTDLVWSPKGDFLAHTTGQLIKIWDPIQGKLIASLEGHKGRVRSLSVSSDGRMLVSKSRDNTIRIWRTDLWKTLEIIEEKTIDEVNPESKVAFHPSKSILASLGENDLIIRIWEIYFEKLVSKKRPTPSIHYSNAKVVLIGQNGSGKTCLARALVGKPFVPQESTHGMNVYNFSTEKVKLSEGTELVREIIIWDLAGQSDYKLTHQLFLDETSIGVIVFDPSDPNNPFKEVSYWTKVLNKVKGQNCPRILCAGKVDLGSPAVSQIEISSTIEKLGISYYLPTSSKNGIGIQKLKNKISELIPWEEIPITTSPLLWSKIREYILSLKENEKAILQKGELIALFKSQNKSVKFSVKDFETVLIHAQSQGLIWRLSFGDLILLKPELLNQYASAIILHARNHAEGLGAVKEDDILNANIDFHNFNRVSECKLEKSLLYSVIELFLSKEIGVRISDQIVFPSKFSRAVPEELPSQKVDLIFKFEGAVEKIFSTLLVRLFYSRVFDLKDIWKNGARFLDPIRNVCGVIIKSSNPSLGEIELFFEPNVSYEIKILFSRFIQEHLEKHSEQDSVVRERVYRCHNCSEVVEGKKAVQKRIERGDSTIPCLFCDASILLVDPLEEKYFDNKVLSELDKLNIEVDVNKSHAVGITTSNAKLYLDEFDVFLAHNSKDKEIVKKIAELLKQRGCNPWIDEDYIPPGGLILDIIQKAIEKSKSAAIFFGIHGPGDWMKLECRTFVSECVKRKVPVIPILLPGVETVPKEFLFLEQFKWINFEDNIEDEELMDNFIWGITGVNPRSIKRKR